MNRFKKLIFLIKRPPILLIIGKGRALAKEAILQVLKTGALIFESDLLKPKEIKNFKFFLRKSKLPILVITNMDKIPSNEVKGLAKALPASGFLVLNFDDEAVREIKNETRAHSLTYGFQERADIKVTDINTSPEGTNFKIDYQGKIVPFWFKKPLDKEQIYNTLAAIAVGIVKDMNLVEISQALKD